MSAYNNVTTLISNATNGTFDECLVAPNYTTLKVLYIILMSLILALSLVGNSVVVISVIMSPILKSRQTYHFAASLACSDMIMAIFQISFRIPVVIQNRNFCFPLIACVVRILMDFFGNVGSILNLLLISIDRFIAINLPYKYPILLSSRRTRYIIIGIWIFSGLWSFSGMFQWTPLKFELPSKFSVIIYGMCQPTNGLFVKMSFFGIYFPSLIVITGCYVKILQIALTQIRKVENSGPSFKRRSKRKSSAGIRRASLLSKELKATKSIAIVYIAFCMCWLPSCVVTLILEVKPDYFQTGFTQEQLYTIWIIISDILPAIITAINPIIYSFSNTHFRKSVLYIWKKYLISTQITDGYSNYSKDSRPSCVSTTVLHRSSYVSQSNMSTIEESPSLELKCGKALMI